MKRGIRYWDSDCFLAWLKDEPDKAEACKGVVDAATNGTIILVTSALTLTEVVKLKGRDPIPKGDAGRVSDFFKNDFIRVRNLDRYVAELALSLVWDHRVLPKDAVHVATAVRHQITIFDTFDTKLIKLSKQIGDPPVQIGKPDLAYQGNLFVDGRETKNREPG